MDQHIGVTLILLAVGSAAYFFPWIVAGSRKHHNSTAIFVLNLLLGWSVLGWIAAIVWACTEVHHTPAN